MSKLRIQPVIMAGGSGTRLWPLSRAKFPKQFLVLKDDLPTHRLQRGRQETHHGMSDHRLS